ncbi:nucleoside triphosphate pyrophosphohydrolase [Oceanirhabdus sp. W0125-5]|uniref:nucleoside triphosphate pyrophosphohydrolase n=1 Tax=Oceanirhabdus sp. W0125-5 TaxID=2999116 RepID=UPI0022F32DA3|nr:nucleoside triphosphate pyrophosphohydrolase [Oceanirhabdus sp. W0125-5]WBW96260.1 nucleoside triphosphate pyrophosphohydrolase [Oceanirhabdus sp. W0125-5]
MKIYNKLIRDKIPQIITADGKKFDTHIASKEEYTQMLEDKLKEETTEYLEDKNLKELADVMEVLFSLAENLGYSEEDLINERNKRNEQRGGFKERIILEKVYE